MERADYELLIAELESVAKAAEITAEVFTGAAASWSAQWASQIRETIAHRREVVARRGDQP